MERVVDRPLAGLVMAAAAVLPGVLDQTSVDPARGGWVLVVAWAIGSVAALALVRRSPALAAVLALVVTGVVEVLASSVEVELTFLTVAPVAVALFVAAASSPAGQVLLATAAIGVLVGAGTIVNRLTASEEWQGGLDILAGVAVMAAGLLGGYVLRSQRQETTVAQMRYRLAAARSEAAARDAVAEERVRIARDLHDLVAHAVTLLVINAETLRARRAELPGWAGDQADEMAAAGRRATEEMRAMLHILTGGDDGGVLPGVDDLDRLVRESSASGTPAALAVAGDAGGLGTLPSLTVYRLVQECLSNARRHAPGEPVDIAVEVGEDAVEVVVLAGAGADGPAEGESLLPGRGLSGIRGRVVDLGGTVTVARTTADRHEVRASVPRAAAG